MESGTVKFRSMVDAKKRVIQTASIEAVRAVQEAAHVLRIMIFLHSAQDFSSVLKLYGIENRSETE